VQVPLQGRADRSSPRARVSARPRRPRQKRAATLPSEVAAFHGPQRAPVGPAAACSGRRYWHLPIGRLSAGSLWELPPETARKGHSAPQDPRKVFRAL